VGPVGPATIAQDGGLGRSTVVGRKLCRFFVCTGANFMHHQDGQEIGEIGEIWRDWKVHA